ncbi:MAG: biopolymer transporter ExbD [Porticoccaceae bacterium]|nr:MAG: biopolymer transporter ExbD [Porticoccaceae bacterium]
MKGRRRRRRDGEVNLTPLIDVVFLLLIFFMVSTTFTRETRLELQLPEAQGEAPPPQEQGVEIRVARDGSYAVNGKALVNRRVETLVEALRRESLGPDEPVLIVADGEAPHRAVVAAMDAAGRAGLTRLRIATREPDAAPAQ